MSRKKTLIFATGNDILTDDGIAIRITSDLGRLLPNPHPDIMTAGCGGLEIIEYIRDYGQVIFIDSIRTAGGEPGDVYHLKPSDFRETEHLSNLHDISFLSALEVARSLNISIPADINIIAIEIVEDRVFSEDFTPVIKEKYPVILGEVLSLVMKIMDL